MAQPAFEEIAEDFAFMEDWEDRYRHVIEMGKAMPPMSDNQKSPLTKVDGCVSQVWIAPVMEGEGPDQRLRFTGDSDAMIVKGLIAILRALLDGEKTKVITETDVTAELGRLGLNEALSAQRSNGLKAMVVRLQQLAKAAEAA